MAGKVIVSINPPDLINNTAGAAESLNLVLGERCPSQHSLINGPKAPPESSGSDADNLMPHKLYSQTNVSGRVLVSDQSAVVCSSSHQT